VAVNSLWPLISIPTISVTKNDGAILTAHSPDLVVHFYDEHYKTVYMQEANGYATINM